jgi:hypothetical protein
VPSELIPLDEGGGIEVASRAALVGDMADAGSRDETVVLVLVVLFFQNARRWARLRTAGGCEEIATSLSVTESTGKAGSFDMGVAGAPGSGGRGARSSWDSVKGGECEREPYDSFVVSKVEVRSSETLGPFSSSESETVSESSPTSLSSDVLSARKFLVRLREFRLASVEMADERSSGIGTTDFTA